MRIDLDQDKMTIVKQEKRAICKFNFKMFEISDIHAGQVNQRDPETGEHDHHEFVT